MKITDQMFLAYRTYMICKAIEDDMARHPNQKGITYMVRSGSSSEVGSFYDLQKEKEKAVTTAQKAAVYKNAKEILGTEGSFYKGSEHTNNNLIPGENIIFAFGATGAEKIMASLLSIDDVHKYTEKEAAKDDYTYETMIFAVPSSVAKKYKYSGTYGKVWGDYQFVEYHMPSAEFEHIEFLKDSVVPDLSTWADNYHKTRDLDELIEIQSRSSSVTSQDPLSFEKFKNVLENDPNFGTFLAMAEDLFETYYADVKEQDEDDMSYDGENEEDDDKEEDEFSKFSEWESDEAFNDRELREVVNDILHNKYYTPAQKRELLEGYADIFNAHARVSELAKAQGFTYVPPTPAKPEESKKPQEPELCQ